MSKKEIYILSIIVVSCLVLYFILVKRKQLSNITKNPAQTIKNIFSPIDVSQLAFINEVKTNKQQFGEKVIKISGELGINPNWLMAVMKNESGINHTIKNPNGSATGLIQFTEQTAKGLGTTTAKLKQMTNVEQLDYVKKYLNTYKGRIKSISDTYLAVFFPLALYRNDDYVFPDWAVKANPIFFTKGKTKKHFIDYVYNKYKKYA